MVNLCKKWKPSSDPPNVESNQKSTWLGWTGGCTFIGWMGGVLASHVASSGSFPSHSKVYILPLALMNFLHVSEWANACIRPKTCKTSLWTKHSMATAHKFCSLWIMHNQLFSSLWTHSQAALCWVYLILSYLVCGGRLAKQSQLSPLG